MSQGALLVKRLFYFQRVLFVLILFNSWKASNTQEVWNRWLNILLTCAGLLSSTLGMRNSKLNISVSCQCGILKWTELSLKTLNTCCQIRVCFLLSRFTLRDLTIWPFLINMRSTAPALRHLSISVLSLCVSVWPHKGCQCNWWQHYEDKLNFEASWENKNVIFISDPVLLFVPSFSVFLLFDWVFGKVNGWHKLYVKLVYEPATYRVC